MSVIDLKNVTVNFNYHSNNYRSLKETIINKITRKKRDPNQKFTVLNDFNLTIFKGQTVGFIGHNGAGKSTLLNILAQTIIPSSGDVKITGSVDSLRNLGAGFDSDLNAVENIYLYLSLLGHSMDYIRSRVRHIIEFAELSEFAKTPVKYYSAGMYARLGFATAIDSSPDILLIDEVINVGDERFAKKCQQVFKTIKSDNKTIVIVSHDYQYLLKFCDRIGIMEKGKLVYYGSPQDAINIYLDQVDKKWDEDQKEKQDDKLISNR